MEANNKTVIYGGFLYLPLSGEFLM